MNQNTTAQGATNTQQVQPAPAQPAQAQPATNQNTLTWHGNQQNQNMAAYNTLNQIKADHLASMPLDQKLELVLKTASTAEKVAYRALKEVGEFDHKLNMALTKITSMLKGNKEVDEPGSSIWDTEEDSESIFGR